jgi:hypothetical protein
LRCNGLRRWSRNVRFWAAGFNTGIPGQRGWRRRAVELQKGSATARAARPGDTGSVGRLCPLERAEIEKVPVGQL